MNLLSKIRRIINPSYSGRDLLVVLGTLVILIAIPFTISLSLQRPSVAPRAATTTTFTTTSSDDGSLTRGWDVCPPSGSSYDVRSDITVGENSSYDGQHFYRRGYLSFSTSALPDEAIIDGVTLKLRVSRVDTSAGAFTVNIYKSNWGPPPMTYTDWNSVEESLQGTLDVTNAGNPAEGSIVSIPVSTSGINKTGRTEYKLRSNKEPYCFGSEQTQFVTFSGAEYSAPELIVVYHLPEPPPPPPCNNECSPSGAKQCTDGTHYKTCGNYDADTCFEWSAATSCPSGKTCSGGTCGTSGGGGTPGGGGSGGGGGTLDSLQLEVSVPYLSGSLKTKIDVSGVSKEVELTGSNKGYNLDLKGNNLSLNKEYNLSVTSANTLVKKVKFTPTSTSLKVGDLILGDLNQDNTIDSTDQLKLIDSIASQTLTGDVNVDEVTNSFDWAILLTYFGKKGD
jgi:uncharacterized membrane protein YgcG